MEKKKICSDIVSRRGHVTAVTGPVGVHKIARIAQQLVGVRAEVVTLGLDQIGRQRSASIAVVERERRAKAWHRYAQQHAVRHHFTPIILSDQTIQSMNSNKITSKQRQRQRQSNLLTWHL